MVIILSPSKTIDTDKVTSKLYTKPLFLNQSSNIIGKLKKYNTQELSQLMSISSKLSQLNYDRYQHWNEDHNLSNSKQAILSFKGEVFTGLNAATFSDEDLEYSQGHLIILSGLYGALRPLDLIQPYRLEISTKLSLDGTANLYNYWQSNIAKSINNELKNHNDNTIINLASLEYFKTIDLSCLEADVITPVFKDFKDGKYKIISIYAKKARGLMSHYIIKNKIEKVGELKLFDQEGYYYNDILSNNQQLIFTRG